MKNKEDSFFIFQIEFEHVMQSERQGKQGGARKCISK